MLGYSDPKQYNQKAIRGFRTTPTCSRISSHTVVTDDLDIDDVRIAVDLKFLLLRRRLARILLLENVVQLLKSAVLRFGDQEVDDRGLDSAPYAEHNVRFPGDVLEGDRESELVDETT